MYNFETKEELIRFIQEEIVNTSEALEILGCSRQNLNVMVQKEKVKPIKEMVRDRLYFKEDILENKKQMKRKADSN
ncbi:DNA-binding protein [Bacillus toyonensis]|uniref:DNA-binding protein n=1 Tax=Bacillus toyonensis TaxID=155322 RepID=UPI000BEDB669|nr:DNA-binding protein [Bacillus toyonensis]MCU4767784.1 DNA-binding protein [Bacillus toyonensis]PEC62968.1 DNA-binding protein [Bacillus toyonensis]